MPATVEITPRQLVGDPNGHDTLDVGDAVLIQRLIVQPDPPRTWDVPANDLNASLSLDSGDVLNVLRVVTGLEAAPAPRGPGLAGPVLPGAGPALNRPQPRRPGSLNCAGWLNRRRRHALRRRAGRG